MGGNGDPLPGQQLQADAPCDAQGCSEAAGEVSPTGGVLGPVKFLLERYSPHGRAVGSPETAVVLRVDVSIGDDGSEGSPAGDIPHEAREKFRTVLLPPCCGGGASPRGPPV